MSSAPASSHPAPYRKPKTWRSDAYLAFVRSRPCVITGMEGSEVVAHHVRCLGGGGVGLKPPDWMCVPITALEHAKLHAMGEAAYWRAHGDEPSGLVVMTMLVYLAQRPSVDLMRELARIVEA